MSEKVLILVLGPNIKAEVNVNSLQISHGDLSTEGSMASSQKEHQLMISGNSIHFMPMSRIDGIYTKKTEDVYEKETDASPHNFGLSVTGIHPMVTKIITSVARRLKSKPNLDSITIDIPELTKKLNEFTGEMTTSYLISPPEGEDYA